MNDTDFGIEISQFNEGLSPLAHVDTETFVGNKGQASEMKADIISKPGIITQSPGLSDLTNGTQASVVDQLIRFILDKPTTTNTTYAVGTTKLFKLSSTTVASGGSPSWPQTITGMTEGESIVRIGADLLIFYNKSSGGDIATLDLGTEVIDDDWGSDTDMALNKAPHPSAVKEDIVVFGNGQYAGVFVLGLNVLDTQKLDFGLGATVVDVVFHANMWWIAVNYGEGKRSQIYLYDGSAISNILSDEAGIGDQEIGFLYVHNGTVFLLYKDKTINGFIVGFVSGRALKPLRYYAGSLPNHRQKALFKNTILTVSDGSVLSCGAPVEQLPLQISNLADGGHATLGAIAAPFGTPMVSSSSGSNHRIAVFSGYSLDSFWKSTFKDLTKARMLGKIHTVIVQTKELGANAMCKIKLEGNQGKVSSSFFNISGIDMTRHVFRSIDLLPLEDVRVILDWSEGNTTNDCPIRKIILLGNYVEN